MNDRLRDLLEYLDSRVDPAAQTRIRERYRRALDWEEVDRPPLALSYPPPAEGRLVPFPHREALVDVEKMLHNELLCGFNMSIVHHHEVGDDLPFSVRANFGTGIIASMFGARIEQHLDDPPWVLGYDSEESFQEVFDRDPLDFSQGLVPRVLETHAFYQATLDDYPALQECVAVVMPDLQGPIDTAELLRGGDIFLDLVIEPERTDRVFAMLVEAQVGVARHLSPHLSEPLAGYSHQHAVLLKGNLLLRDDTAILISKEMYESSVAPHDQRVLAELGGGAIHSCGNFGHIAAACLELDACLSLDLGQPLLNDLDTLYQYAARRRIPLVRADATEEDLRSGAAARRFPTGVVFRHEAHSLDHARAIAADYQRHS